MPAIQKITTFLWFDNNAEEAIHFYLSVFEVRDAGRNRYLVGNAVRGRREGSLRMAQRQIWSVLANRPRGLVRNVARPGFRKGRSRHASDDANGQARHPAFAAGLQPTLTVKP